MRQAAKLYIQYIYSYIRVYHGHHESQFSKNKTEFSQTEALSSTINVQTIL